MDNTLSTTEEKILEAAKKVFHSRGYDGARMQEIANEAGVNKALVHYYFRNKDNLYEAVFKAAFSELMSHVSEIFGSTAPLTEKVAGFTRYYVGFLSENSYLPIFILNSLYKNPGQFREMVFNASISPKGLLDTIRIQMKEELGLEIDPMHIYINILSLSIFPVVARPLIREIFGFSDEQLNRFYNERVNAVPEFILNALKGYDTQTSQK